MSLCFRQSARRARPSGSFHALLGCGVLGAAIFACALIAGGLVPAVFAQQPRTATDGVYTADQAKRGEALYRNQCASCHGVNLTGDSGPPLTGDEFVKNWVGPLSDIVNKISLTMPVGDPGRVTRSQATDILAHMLQVGKFAAGTSELVPDQAALTQISLSTPESSTTTSVAAASGAPTFPPAGNMAQVMRGILFPSSNLIFNVQTEDPGVQTKGWSPEKGAFSWVNWGAGIYTGWELVDYAAIALAESAPLMLTPGRRCENGRPVPVDRPDWIQFTKELAETGKAIYKVSQSRDRDAVSEITNRLADSCLNCHLAYRDKPGGTPKDPSNKSARCQ